MHIDIDLQSTDPAGRTFLTWAPVQGTLRLREAGTGQSDVPVILRNGGISSGGRVVFDTKRSDDGAETLNVVLPASGAPVTFWIAGEFQKPSSVYGDAAFEAVTSDNNVLGRQDLMVRIRKNAVKLTSAERDRFLQALGRLNAAGLGPFQGFRDTHVQTSRSEAHGYAGFPPWHRAYLLDLERSLQDIDPTVTLPYWRFDEPAPELFAPEFLGMPPADPGMGDVIDFPHGHPLEFWKTDGADPIERRPFYDISAAPPQQDEDGNDAVITQNATMALGDQYAAFRRMERAPHGPAHTSFLGPINSVPTAAKDPLFFLLHANVDRLWAFWQWRNRRYNSSDDATYSLLGGSHRVPDDIGHKLNDTMWPWNGSTTPPRPTTAPPRGPFPASGIASRPGGTPKIRDMIDYQGVNGSGSLGFDYDDVPFELQPGDAVS